MLKRLSISLLITLLVSTGIGFSLYSIFHTSLIGVTLLTFIVQLIGFYFFYDYKQSKAKRFWIEDEKFRLEQFAKISTVVSCAYCQTKNYIPINLDIQNELKCNKCNKISSVFITVEAAQQTTLVSVDLQTTQKILKEATQTAMELSAEGLATIV